MSSWCKCCITTLIVMTIMLTTATLVITIQVINKQLPVAEISVVLLIIGANAWQSYQHRYLRERIMDLEVRSAVRDSARRLNAVD